MLDAVLGDAGGFAVDPGTLGAVAGELGQAYDELNDAYGEVIACSDAGGESGESVFGAPEAVTAWNAFCAAFCDEFQEDVAALAELIDKLRQPQGRRPTPRARYTMLEL